MGRVYATCPSFILALISFMIITRNFSDSVDTKITIKYTAQINDNGELYVKVYGDLPR